MKKNIRHCLYNLLLDALNLRKINLIGGKMKVYLERVKRTNYSKVLQDFNEKQTQNDQIRALTP